MCAYLHLKSIDERFLLFFYSISVYLCVCIDERKLRLEAISVSISSYSSTFSSFAFLAANKQPKDISFFCSIIIFSFLYDCIQFFLYIIAYFRMRKKLGNFIAKNSYLSVCLLYCGCVFSLLFLCFVYIYLVGIQLRSSYGKKFFLCCCMKDKNWKWKMKIVYHNHSAIKSNLDCYIITLLWSIRHKCCFIFSSHLFLLLSSVPLFVKLSKTTTKKIFIHSIFIFIRK